MKALITRNEAKQLRKQGYNVVAGQIVDVENMPEWIKKRAESVEQPISAEMAKKLAKEHDEDIKWAQMVRKNVAAGHMPF